MKHIGSSCTIQIRTHELSYVIDIQPDYSFISLFQ
jgi:hypothetical protein